jgi:predicted enzyme related to lactoylglutathione lyase
MINDFQGMTPCSTLVVIAVDDIEHEIVEKAGGKVLDEPWVSRRRRVCIVFLR